MSSSSDSSQFDLDAQPAMDSDATAATYAAATTSVHHAQISNFDISSPFYRGGMRSGVRSTIEAEQMLHKVPPSYRSGTTPAEATANTQSYLSGKDASHVISHKNGGSGNPQNMTWEAAGANRARGSNNMSFADRSRLGVQWHLDNLQGALQAGLRAAPKGALVGAVTAAPFSMMTHCLRVMRGEISTEVAVWETLKDTTLGAGIGGVSAMGITTIATACPPVAAALAAASPLLLTVGAGAMVYEFFKILEDHKREVRAYYQQLTKADLERLAILEAEWQYQHQKNLNFIQQSRQINAQINDRPVGSSIEDALNRYKESAAIALSLGAIDPAEIPILLDTHARFLPAQET